MAASQTTQLRNEYRKDIDGLRAIAVISVIINHFNPGALPGGYLGVDIFFVISGYVITASLENARQASLTDHLLHFYSRRIKRLMPALITMALITSSAIRLFDPDANVSTITGVASVFGLSNLFLFMQATNYFGATVQRNAFGHTWSLGVEEQFYLIYPLLLLLRRPPRVHSFRDDRIRIVGLSVLSLISLFFFIGTYKTNQPAAYFLMPYRFWELGAGCLLALVSRVPRAGLDPSIPFLTLLFALFAADRYPVACTIAVVAATSYLIGWVRREAIITHLLVSSPAAYLGAISYSLYLWHWPILCISRWTVGIHLYTVPFQLLAILLLSIGSYHLIENPLRRSVWVGGRRGVLALGLPVMAATVLVMLLGQRKHIPRFSGNLAETVSAPVPGYVGKFSNRRLDDCFADAVFGAKGGSPQNRINRCEAEVPGRVRLVFVGDSHATDLFPMSDQIYHRRVASVLNISQPGCIAPALGGEWPLCNYPELILRRLSQNPGPGNILVIRNNYAPRLVEGQLGDFTNRLDALLARTSAAHWKVIYVAPAPKYYSIGPYSICTPQWYRPRWAMSSDCQHGFVEDRGEEIGRRRDFMDRLVALSHRRTDFFVFDPFIVLCGSTSGNCTPVRAGRLIYRDDSHLTEEGSELLTDPFEAFLKEQRLVQ